MVYYIVKEGYLAFHSTAANIGSGFITATGTPLTPEGALQRESFERHLEDQIAFGASGILAMGTMGIQAYLVPETYAHTARAAAAIVDGRIPVLLGVMDNSCARVLERCAIAASAGADGVVATTPYYHNVTQTEIVRFFQGIARDSRLPVYIYDLPAVTKSPVAPATALALLSEPNIAGIKSANLQTCKVAHFEGPEDRDFSVMYSGLDTFDAAYTYGITRNLDGMFSCAPVIAKRMYAALAAGQVAEARAELQKILSLRDAMAEVGIFRGFTAVMNNLGYAGCFHPDYMSEPTDKERRAFRSLMSSLGVALRHSIRGKLE